MYGSNILSLHDSDIFFTVNFLCLRGWCRRDLGYPEQPQQVGHLKQGGWRSTWNWEGAGQPETEKLQVNLKSGVLFTEIGWLHPKIGCLPSQIGCIHPEIGCLLNKIGYPHPLLRCLFNEIGCLQPEIECLHPVLRCLFNEIGCLHPKIGCLLNKIGCLHPEIRRITVGISTWRFFSNFAYCL